jgi:acetolactate synthase I/II/III large subunit
VDTIGITRPCVKHNFLVKDVRELAVTLKKAFVLAATGRPGPVVVDVPKDVTAQRCRYVYPESVQMRSYSPVLRGHPGQIRKAAQLLTRARRPMIYTGGGVILGGGAAALTRLVRHLGYPVTNTLMGLGGYPGSDPQFLGMLGMHGTVEANMAMHECDVLLAVGARFDDRVTGEVSTFCPNARIVHVDIDPSCISKTVRAEVPIVGSVVPVLEDLLAEIERLGEQPDAKALAQWWAQINRWRAQQCLAYDKTDARIKPQAVIQALHRVTRGQAYVTSDVGQHQMWTAQFYPFDLPNRWINSGGLGTMGFGLPAALGVKLAFPDADVACVTGEASIQMCIQELSTARQYGLPVKIVNLNNGYMGMVRQWQEFQYKGRYSHSYVDALPDFVRLAEAYGHVGMKVEKPGDVEGALREAFGLKDRLVFLDVMTDPAENVYPMVEAGKGQHEMRLSPMQLALRDRELA